MPHITRRLSVITPYSHLTIQKIDTYNAVGLQSDFLTSFSSSYSYADGGKGPKLSTK